MNLMGMVTLYHPTQNVVSNISSYIDGIDKLLIIDNTEEISNEVSTWFLKWGNKIEYVAFGDNKGIAFALNYALQQASGFDFLLTMDQDSFFPKGMIKRYREMIAEMEKNGNVNVGMYTLNYDYPIDPIMDGWKEIEKGITSGSVLPIKKAIKLGCFDEQLFIDEVDNEYCYRSRKNGYSIIEFPSILLNHSIGERKYFRIGNHKYFTFNHNAIRKYYITRNKIYVMKKYSMVRKSYIEMLIKMTLKVILAEENKISKLKYIIKGCKDGFLNHMGKIKYSN